LLEINERFQHFLDELQATTEDEVQTARNNIFWSDLLAYVEDSTERSQSKITTAEKPVLKK